MTSIKKLVKINYENMMKIDDKYQDLVTDIVCYIRGELTQKDAEEAINDINEILLGAQERGEDIFTVVGDYEIFCKEIVESYKIETKTYIFKKVLDYIPTILYSLIFFIAIDMVSSILEYGKGIFNNFWTLKYTLSLAPILNSVIAAIIAIVIIENVCKIPTTKTRNKKFDLLIVFAYIAITGILVVTGLFARKVEILTLKNCSILIIISFIIVAIQLIKMIKFAIFDKK